MMVRAIRAAITHLRDLDQSFPVNIVVRANRVLSGMVQPWISNQSFLLRVITSE
jgi:hypothetical protein